MNFTQMTRREMLLNTSGLAMTGLGLRIELLRAAAPGFKIGACDWTIGKRTDPSALEMAKKLRLDGVQVDFGSEKEGLPLRNPEIQKKYLEMSKQVGVPISSLALGVLNEVPLKNDPRAELWLAESVRVCQALGVKVVLVPFFGKADLRNDKPGMDVVVERFKRVAPQAEKAGVIFGIESMLSAEQHIEILKRVASPAVQVYYDVGNSQSAGYDIFEEIRVLGKRICEFHAKDNKDLYGKGTMNFPQVRRAMDGVGYRGWIQIEGSKLPLGVEASVRYDLDYMRCIFPRET